mgnify:CR=1 FL=1
MVHFSQKKFLIRVIQMEHLLLNHSFVSKKKKITQLKTGSRLEQMIWQCISFNLVYLVRSLQQSTVVKQLMLCGNELEDFVMERKLDNKMLRTSF